MGQPWSLIRRSTEMRALGLTAAGADDRDGRARMGRRERRLHGSPTARVTGPRVARIRGRAPRARVTSRWRSRGQGRGLTGESGIPPSGAPGSCRGETTAASRPRFAPSRSAPGCAHLIALRVVGPVVGPRAWPTTTIRPASGHVQVAERPVEHLQRGRRLIESTLALGEHQHRALAAHLGAERLLRRDPAGSSSGR